MSTDYAIVLAVKYPDAVWHMNADDYDQLVWLSDSPKPTKAELDGLWVGVQAELQAEAQAKIDARESALAKLGVLGLDEAEIKALLGL
jgi:hypothetical protein